MKKKKTNLKLFNEFATRDKIKALENLLDILPDPDEILAENNYDYDIYTNLLTDPHLMAAIQQRKQQIMQMEYEIDHDSNTKIVDEAKEIISNLPIKTFMSDILDCVLFGMSIQEITYDLIQNKIIPIDVQTKPQKWFIFNKENELLLRRNEGGVYLFEDGQQLPQFKFIVNQYNPTYDNPYGEKILSRCYWPITWKRTALENWQSRVEQFGMPFLIGYYATAATPAEQDELLTQLEDLITNNVGVMDEAYINKVEFKETPKFDIGQLYELLVKFHNTEISKAVLTVTLTVDTGQTGSYKLGEVHKQMLEYIGLTDKKIVEAGVNKLLQYWHYINYGNIDAPKFQLKKKSAIIVESAERDERLHKMGINFTKEYYQKRYNLAAEDFELLKEKK